MRLFICLVGLLLSLVATAETGEAIDYDWLVGCWETTDGTSREVWVKEPDGSLIGFAVDISDNSVSFFEILRVAIEPDGTAIYTAYPFGHSPTSFTATEVTAHRVVFANPNHDFPQEITYRAEGANLFATISGLNGIDPQTFNKSRCD